MNRKGCTGTACKMQEKPGKQAIIADLKQATHMGGMHGRPMAKATRYSYASQRIVFLNRAS